MMDESSKKIHAALKAVIKNAWIVMSLLPDVDARFRAGLRGAWTLPVVYDAAECYNYNPPWLKRAPTPREITTAEIVMQWMIWLRQTEGRAAVARIISWSMGRPMANMAAQERCSDRTIQNRIDRSVAAVQKEFLVVEPDEIETIEEPELSNKRMRGFSAPHDEVEMNGANGEVHPGKVFIDGIGFMHRGVKYRSATD